MRARPLALALALAVVAAPGTGCERPRTWTARIVVSLSGAAGRPVHGLDVTVSLPAGALVTHDPSTRRISAAALSPGSGAPAATLAGSYAAHATAPHVRLLVAS